MSVLTVAIPDEGGFYSLFADGLFAKKTFDKASGRTFLDFGDNAVIFLFYTYPALREICAVRNAPSDNMVFLPGLSQKVSPLFTVRASAVDRLRRAIGFLNRRFGGAYSWDDGFYIRLFFLVRQRGPLSYPALRKLAEASRDRGQSAGEPGISVPGGVRLPGTPGVNITEQGLARL
jgi:hypothetical protein